MPKKPDLPIGLDDGSQSPNPTVKTVDGLKTPLLEMSGENGLAVAFVRSLG